MKSLFIKMFILLTVLVLSSAFTIAQINWTKYPGNPVLPGQPGTWYAYSSMNSVLYNADSSRYEMWFTAGAQIAYPYTIGYAWSSDGIYWNVYDSIPVLTPTSGSWDAYMVLAPYVLRENGQYKMWYTGCATSSILDRIGYATSPNGINWTKHTSNPVLEPSTAPWESAAVAYPCIMPYSNGYKMWYGGYSANISQTGIGYATSPDGITWERYAGNPVMSPGAIGQWDHVVFGPRVLFKDNIYYMFYSGETVAYQSDKIGLATSADGLVWIKYPSNPVLQPTPGQWDGSRTILGSVMLDADTLKMHYCGMGTGGSNMEIGLATSPYTPFPLPPGTYTIGTGGNFATIQEAFDKLSTDGVAGNVTLELIDDLYTAPTGQVGFLLYGPIPGAGPNKRVTIKPAVNKNVTIEGYNQVVIDLYNTSYTTIDGVGLSGSTTLTVHAYHNAQYQWNDCMGFYNDCDHNIIQNTTFISDDYTRSGSGLGLYTPTGYTSACDSNLIQYNFIPRGGWAMYLSANNSSLRATGNIIRGNKIGSETDSLIAWGIQIEHCQNTIVENNIVQNLKITPNFGEIVNMGINSWWGSGDIIRNNVVQGIKSIAGYMSVGILLSGNGNDNIVYNNMVYDIQSTSAQSYSRVSGIQIFNQNNPKIYYNSVYLYGAGANPLGSAALYIYTNVTNADIRNNILINTRDESPYCASAVYDYSVSNLTSDYNDLYYDDTNSDNCLVRAGGTDYLTLAQWQAMGKDLNSITEMSNFVSPDLHINGGILTLLDGGAAPIVGIDTDIDGETRNATVPDIGADEFLITDVEDETTLPTEFALEQNYPNPFNPSTTFRYSIPQTSKVVIKVFDILGNEIATLMDEEKSVGTYELTWNAANLPSGVYFYRMQAGNFVETKKMLLLK